MAKKKESNESLSPSEQMILLKKEMEKKYGQGALIGAKDKSNNIEVISTNSIGLDKALGIGGLPKGRIIEIYGSESSGKTTLTLEVISKAMENPESYCGFVDAEHAIDIDYAENLGVDLNRLEISQPDSGEQALDIVESMLDSNLFDVIVVDSVAALVPKSELEGDMGDSSMGKHARLMSQAMRKLTGKVNKSNTCLIFINQLRDKIGVMFGDPSTTTGGNALKFYASVRLEVSRSTTEANSLKEGDYKIGNITKVKVVKNKLAPPFKTASFYILYGKGIDVINELIDIADNEEIIRVYGKSITYNDVKYDGEEFRTMLETDSSLFKEIKQKILEK